jgi:hypothetical protein
MKNEFKIIFASFLFVFICYSAKATIRIVDEQIIDAVSAIKTDSDTKMIKVRGKVMNEKKEPVMMAAVVVKDSRIGTISDVDGTFILEIPAKSTVVISSKGMTKFEIVVEEDVNDMEVILKPEEPQTNE